MIHIFIVNPYAGQKTFADDLRQKLSEIQGLKYFVFNSRYAGYERDVVKKIQNIFQDEKLRFYCCGGSGTMRNMLNGFDDLSQAEVAFFPCGLTNDFLKVFGEEERFRQIEELIYGDVIAVDYIRTNHGIALNTFSVGLDSILLNKLEEYRITSVFGKQMPYVLGLAYAMFAAKPQEYEIYLDDTKVEGIFAEIFFGNGHVLGGNLHFSEPACVNDGSGSYVIAPNWHGFGTIPVIRALSKKNFERLEKIARCGVCEKIRIRRKDGTAFTMNFDGELVRDVSQWEAEIVKQGLHLVVPKGVTA